EVALYYVKGELRLVQNFTIDTVYVISRRSCYLATYVYGSGSKEVALLRRFRDEVLLRRATLALLVSLYYRVSPRLIALFGNARWCKTLGAGILTPAVYLVRRWASRRVRQTGKEI